MNFQKRTKIVATIGPASDKKEILSELIKYGLNVCRLNFSHGIQEEHKMRMDTIKLVRKELDLPIAILLDTKGPEIRTGKFKSPEVLLKEGQKFIITMNEVQGDENKCTVSYKYLTSDVKCGDRILIDDGLVGLKVEDIKEKDIICTVENSGIIKNNKGVNVPNVKINLPAITDKDKNDIEFGIKEDIDFIAASFVRKASDVLAIREILEANNADHIQIIAKIENQEGVDNIDEILKVSDGLMIARGDLGVEIPTEEIPIVQKMMIKKCNELGKPVITATQMLDSMMRNPRPTRAEVTDVANAIYDGTDAIMLSGETAAGKYPIESVKTMASIAKRTEEVLDYDAILKSKKSSDITVTNAISHATCTTAIDLKARAIITATSLGSTARTVSKFRPKAPIIAATPYERVMRKLALSWGVYPVISPDGNSTDEVIENAINASLKVDFIKDGDLVVITAGVPVGVSGTTNLIKVHLVTEILAKGVGIGKSSFTGRVCIINEEKDKVKFKDGDILVTVATDIDMNDYIEKSGAVITESGGITSHAAIVALNLGKTVIVSAKDATINLKDGQIITMDPIGGVVYSGHSRV